MTVQPIAPNLFEHEAAGAYLWGGRRRSDGRIVFPLPQGAAATEFEPIRLSRTGTLWSWTVQRFRPKSPPYAGADDATTFKPYAVGYVELPGEIIVESRLSVADFSVLRLGLPMEAIVEPFGRTGEGQAIATYAFRPIREARAS